MTDSADVLEAAAQLARSGQHAAALVLLDALATELPAAEVDLLRGKILAQQQDFPAAVASWERVLEHDPESPEARQGIATAERLGGRRVLVFWRAKAAVAGLLVALFAGTLALGRGPSAAADQGDELSVSTARQEQIRALRRELDAAHERLAVAESAPARPPDLDLEIPGVAVRELGDRLQVRFAAGLFDRGVGLAPGAEDLLGQVARRLAARQQPISIRVIGHTNALPVPGGSIYRDNDALGLARAAVVVDVLRSLGPLPARNFVAATRGALGAPFSGDLPDHEQRNRTVTLEVRRSEQ